jgi:hypothetical protein
MKAKNLVEQKKANRPEPRSEIIVSPVRTRVRSLLTPGSPYGKRADEVLGFCTGRPELREVFRGPAGDEQFSGEYVRDTKLDQVAQLSRAPRFLALLHFGVIDFQEAVILSSPWLYGGVTNGQRAGHGK